MPFISTKKAAELLGGKVYISTARVRIAYIVDNIYMKTLALFDQSSISRVHRWLLQYARIHLFQKMQTLFQMGKKKQFLELLDYVEEQIPVLRELANDPMVFLTVSGKILDEEETEKEWNREAPDWLKRFVENTRVWKELETELTR